MKKIRSLIVAGATEYECFYQHLRLLDGAFKLSAKDLRSQVVREACITVAHLSTVLGNKLTMGPRAFFLSCSTSSRTARGREGGE
nr:CLIP-associating protein 2-like [Salvelinus alpinus]